jgi:hypothetical protein
MGRLASEEGRAGGDEVKEDRRREGEESYQGSCQCSNIGLSPSLWSCSLKSSSLCSIRSCMTMAETDTPSSLLRSAVADGEAPGLATCSMREEEDGGGWGRRESKEKERTGH